jgi:DNA-binding beta-propeller fold protein YncE
LLLRADRSISLVNAADGAVLVAFDSAVAAPDWSRVASGSIDGDTTTVTTIDPATAETMSTTSIPGAWDVRAVSPLDGRLALMAPDAAGGDSWAPTPKTTTDLLVAAPDGSPQPQTIHLDGNFEPEAFSTDGKWLAMLEYRPALNPTSYRVTSLDLSSDKIDLVYGPDKAPVENMTATRLHQAAAPDSSALYTLYTNQPPAYLDASAVEPEEDEVAFVHTLGLVGDIGFAFCTALPNSFGTTTIEGSALAIAPDGSQVFAIDADHGNIAILDPDRQRMSDHAVDLSALGGGPISAGVTRNGRTLLVAGRAGVLPLDAATLEPGELVPTPAPVTGMAIDGLGGRLFVSWAGGIEQLDPESLQQTAMIASPAPGAIAFAGPEAPAVAPPPAA